MSNRKNFPQKNWNGRLGYRNYLPPLGGLINNPENIFTIFNHLHYKSLISIKNNYFAQ